MVLAACSTMRTNIDYDPSYDFNKARTYNWIPNPQIAQANELFDKHFRKVMDEKMAAKGYSVNESNPDFLIAYHGDVQSKVDVTNWGYRYPGWYGGVEVYQYEEGTLIVDFVDSASKDLIYRATLSAEMDRRSTDFERRQKRISEAVDKILKGFPPTKK
jgi:hypothetical protein